MHCTSCGAHTAEGAAFCNSCGRPIVGYSLATATPPSAGGAIAPVGAVAPSSTREYAGFWLRLVAYLIDSIIFTVVFGIVIAIAIGFLGIGFLRSMFEEMGAHAGEPNTALPAMFILTIVTFGVFGLVVSWLYYAGMESSEHQGTLGKMALGLVVTDMNGQPVTFARASGRFFGKMITGLVPLAIGYIMAGFTEKKQALHDMIASCLVLRKA
jgi:uncharacterized RDD family membrane protein YckC